MNNKLIFSGIQPTGQLHLGNYLGAIKNWVKLQEKEKCIFSIVDLHAITVFQNPNELKNNIIEMTACLIASGINTNENILFKQSDNPNHTELNWLFNCVARMGWLNRMTQFKEKSGKNKENSSVGLFTYPSLQAADILAYHATHVPVGQDQKQHLELCRDIAAKFNNDFGVDFFPIIEPLINKTSSRVMSLRDGTKKMSKSDPSDLSRVNIIDENDVILKKFKKAKSDEFSLPSGLNELDTRPEAKNLLEMYADLNDISLEKAISENAGIEWSEFKTRIADSCISVLEPIRTNYFYLLEDKQEIYHTLIKGGEKSLEISQPILDKTKNIMGLSFDGKN